MSKLVRRLILPAAGVSAALAVTVLLGRRRFRVRLIKDVAGLLALPGGSVGPEQLAARWGSLPEPVRRYLRYAISRDAPALRTVRLQHDGFFRTQPGRRWMRIQGEEYFTVAKPGFVWRATVTPAPLFWIDARDRLLGLRGNMLVKFYSTFTIADASSAEIDQAAKMRWLAEAVWFPLAFVGDHISWEPINEGNVRATLLGEGLPVSAIFEVDEEGRITCLRGERYRDTGRGKAVLTPWIGRCTEYRELNGFHVPCSVEVLWNLTDGEFSYARFHVTRLEYNVVERF
jgi:hypothetical protein